MADIDAEAVAGSVGMRSSRPQASDSMVEVDDARVAVLAQALRLRAGLTQVQLAQRLGKPQSFIAKTETGVRPLRVVDLVNWSRACGWRPGRALDVLLDVPPAGRASESALP